MRLAVSGGVKPLSLDRVRFAVGADQRRGTAWLVEQVSDLAQIADAPLAQQRVHVGVRQPGAGQFPLLELAAGDEDAGRMVDQADGPAVAAQDRDDAMRDEEGDQRNR